MEEGVASDAEMAIGPDVIIWSRLDLDITIRTYSTARTSAPFTVDSPLNGLSHIAVPPYFASVDRPIIPSTFIHGSYLCVPSVSVHLSVQY